MKLFNCQNCFSLLYFENTLCTTCSRRVGFLPAQEVVSAVEPAGNDWLALADPNQHYRFCANWEHDACNWMVKAESAETYCRACQHDRIVPDVNGLLRDLWQKMESAKRRLFYSLIKLRLPLPLPNSGDIEPLVFDFLTDVPGRKAITGHANGTITISLAEADDAKREKTRTNMHEPYRTLLGHFRHEVGHFYWDRLVRDQGQLDSFRAVFGDERANYDVAVSTYYSSGPTPNWQQSYVSGYATMHPWEDFAETWAHYLHIVDTLEMAYASSDRRLKENIAPTSRGLDALLKIRSNDFNFIADPKKARVQGFIAQDLNMIYPEAVNVGGDDPKTEPWSVDYGRLTPLLVKSIQDQQSEIAALKADNDNEAAEMKALRADVEALKAARH